MPEYITMYVGALRLLVEQAETHLPTERRPENFDVLIAEISRAVEKYDFAEKEFAAALGSVLEHLAEQARKRG